MMVGEQNAPLTTTLEGLHKHINPNLKRGKSYMSDSEPNITTKLFKLIGADGKYYQSSNPGTLGGNRKDKIYGTLGCKVAIRALSKKNQVFFADKETAIAAGYRPCGSCMKSEYKTWRAGGVPGSIEYPWLITPDSAKEQQKIST